MVAKTTEPGQSLTLPHRWKQGEHVAIVGSTGSGKSVLLSRIIEARRYRIIIRTKPDDVRYRGALEVSTLRGLERDRGGHAYVLDPEYDEQGPEIWSTLEWVWQTGGWAVAIDEGFYVTELGRDLENEIKKLMTQGRSKRISMVVGTQRPVEIPRFCLSEATHLIAFGLEGRDVLTMKEVAGPRFADAISGLKRYQFAWFYRPERSIWIGKLDRATGRLEPVKGG